MIDLPNGNKCSQPTISPKKYKSAKSIKRDWFIQYRFYSKEFPAGKLIIKKGFNGYTDLATRKQAAERSLSDLIQSLKRGYNPLEKKMVLPPDHEVTETTPFSMALRKGFEKLRGGKHSLKVIGRTVNFFVKVSEELKFHFIPVTQIKRRHIKQLLEKCAELRNFTPGNYNHHRAYLMMIFKELMELDVIESNPVKDIRKRAEIKKIRETLTTDERILVSQYLHKNFYTFWRYLQIFYHSGSRSTELLRLQCKDVDLDNRQIFKLTIIKGTNKGEVRKVIKDSALPYWREAVQEGKPDDYVFAKGLKPGPVAIHPDQITKRWYKNVKLKLDIKADFYSIKHSASDDLASILSLQEAGLHNSHTSTKTTRIYAINEDERQAERLKKVGNKFA